MIRNRNSKDERGAIAITVAVLLTVMIGIGAVAVDLGQVYAERAQLQNGADASALAVAQACASNATNCNTSMAQSLAAQYTSANSQDAANRVRSIDLEVPAGTITVQTSTPASGLALTFARVLGKSSMAITASATARWGYPGSSTGFPLALSSACFDLTPGAPSGDLQQFSYKPGTGSNGGNTKLDCTDSASGKTIPGGWGWLNQSPANSCQVSTTAGGTVSSDQGANPAAACYNLLTTWIGTLTSGGTVDVLFPVFDAAQGNGSSGSFTILGYATLQVYAWQFSGAGNTPYTYMPPTIPSNVKCAGSDRCVVGKFVSFQTSATGGTGGPNLGTSQTGLIK